MKSFNVIIHDFNSGEFKAYDVMPYLSDCWKTADKKEKAGARGNLKKWIDNKLKYMFWSRCEYEVVLRSWPIREDDDKKIDVYWQCKMNLELIVEIFKENVKWRS